ncbi:hypothetical protein ACH5RR_032521 [Cinchona calisaya]|uniref:Reverse transcriptase RNase H-like domain-containing protein n=1 Tax=Cinchona calisaya TaxID=153742 RepID=A0ABD2YKV3_9GENT
MGREGEGNGERFQASSSGSSDREKPQVLPDNKKGNTSGDPYRKISAQEKKKRKRNENLKMQLDSRMSILHRQFYPSQSGSETEIEEQGDTLLTATIANGSLVTRTRVYPKVQWNFQQLQIQLRKDGDNVVLCGIANGSMVKLVRGKPLKEFLQDKARGIQPIQHSWLTKLLGPDYEIQYKAGVENKAVDTLSRKGSQEQVRLPDSALLAISSIQPAWIQ